MRDRAPDKVMTMTVSDGERGCGWRREGGIYLVSADNSTGGPGTIGVSEAAAGLILIDPPIPIDPTTVPTRGYAYVDGEAIVTADPAGPALAVTRIPPEIAEARAFSWRMFGLDYGDRVGQGLCAQDDDVEAVLRSVSSLAWRDREAYLHEATVVHTLVEQERDACGDVQLLPLIVAAKQAYQTGAADAVAGYGLIGAGAALAACWRLIHAARWLGDVRIVQHTAGYLIPACGARADAPYALRLRPPAYRPAPDIVDWVGERFYPTAEEFVSESRRLGISRRMPGIPKAVVTPWSRAFLAHAKCRLGDGSVGPGIFGYYQVAQMQYIVSGRMAIPPWLQAHGVQPVRVRRQVTQRQLIHA